MNTKKDNKNSNETKEIESSDTQSIKDLKVESENDKANSVSLQDENDTDKVVEKADEGNKLQGFWYVLHTYSGQEKKVELSIHQAIEKHSLQDKIFKVIVPEEETIEIKGGKRVEKTRKIFPGYVFVNMFVDDDVWSMLRRIPGFLKFVGMGNEPEPVKDEEMLKILRRMGIKSKRVEVDFEIGEVIKIISGPFRGYTGGINEINIERGKLKTLISIFGRETPVELVFDQVEKTK